ncbi:hypothetical protein [Tenacibaculum agarivorans]|uniref:hypothetical protein n=1 Tax=Tenacibaculum agarivorans TaxID=1908389 RepID=UPI00094BBEA1|nr:hypothetical protein [Tenacibaculum agarivorans]
MLLKNIPSHLTKDSKSTVTTHGISYEISFTFLPFTNSETQENYLNTEVKDLLTPIFHLELNAIDIEESIYRSNWIMPGQILWFIEQHPDSDNIMDLANLVIESLKYEERIEEYAEVKKQRLLRDSQLSLF